MSNVVSLLLCFLMAALCLSLMPAMAPGVLRRAAVGGFVVFLVLGFAFAFGPVTGWPS